MTQRRDLLKSALLLPLLSTTAARSLAASQPAAPARKFDFAALKGDAERLGLVGVS